MTISEAIEQQIKAAEAFEKSALEKGVSELTREGRKKVADEHRQLAEWLTELKGLREENKGLMSECDRLIKEKGELLKMTNRPCTLCGNNCQVSPLEQSKARNGLCEARECMHREDGDMND